MKKYISILLVLLLLTGCGGASTGAVFKSEASYDMAAPAEAPAMAVAEENGVLAAAGDTAVTEAEVPENRKWIVTVFLSAEAEDLEVMTDALEARIVSFGGYVENQSVYNGSSYEQVRHRSANLTIRIPAEKVDSFVESVDEVSNITSQEKTLEDITLTYVDTESRMKALKTEETRLLELLAEAETMADLLEIEGRLTDVRYELDSVTSRLRTMDNQVNYATIHLNIREVQEYTPVEEPTFFERITKGFKDSLEGVGEGAVDLTAWIIINLPYLVVYGVLLAVAIPLARWLRKRAKARKEAKKAKKAAKNQPEA